MAKKKTKSKVGIPSSIGGVKTEAKESLSQDLVNQLKLKYGENINVNELTPEELHQLQLEQAIRESNDPTARLQKITSPLNSRNITISIFVFLFFTIALSFVFAYFQVDRFNFVKISLDMLDKLGITKVYNSLKDWFLSFFNEAEAEAAIRFFVR